MRRALIVLLSCSLVVVSCACVASAASRTGRGSAAPHLTISSLPNPSFAGQPVVISGRLSGPHATRARVVLWQRLPGQRRFHHELVTRTDATGRYAISRPADAIARNRRWFVTGARLRSRIIEQRVRALVTLRVSTTSPSPGEVVTFIGRVTPSHQRDRILLQQQFGRRWATVERPRLDRRSDYVARHTFALDGIKKLRAELRGDDRNVRSISPVITVTVDSIHKIKHVVIIMQENRSFDQYFGTYPGAAGIPPGVCVPDPKNGGCVKPFHDSANLNYGGPHGQINAAADINGGKMDGFVGQAEKGKKCGTTNPNCSPCNKGSRLSAST